MKLRSLLRLIVAALVAGVLILATVLAGTFRESDEIAKVSQALNDLTLGVAELHLLTNDYVRHPGPRPAEQWLGKWRALQDLIDRALRRGGPGGDAVGWIARDLAGANDTFAALAAGGQEPAAGVGRWRERQSLLIGRLDIQLQSVLANASQLRETVEEREAQVRRQGFLRAAAVLLLVVSIVAGSAVVLMRRLAAPLARLREGAARFGAGELDYRLAIDRRDEFGELAEDMQRMAARLKEITASRSELQREIAERERAEASFRQLFDSSRDAILSATLDGRIRAANRAACELTGYTEAELRQLGYRQITPPRWLAAEDAIVREQLMVRGYTDVYEKEYVRKDGSVVPVGVRASLAFDREGRPQALWGIVRDISGDKTAQRERERLLLQQQAARRQAEQERAQVEAIFRSIREGISVFDMTGRLVLFNPALVRIFGLADDEALCRDLDGFNRVFELISPDGAALPVDQWPVSRVLAGEAVERWEVGARRRDTGQAWSFEFSGGPVRDRDGRQVFAVIVTRDVTERKRLVEALHALNSELERRVRERTAQLELANKELEAFSYSVSHDLKTPVRAVSGFVEILEEDFRHELSDEALETIKVIRDNAVRMQQLIDDLLAFSRLSRSALARAPVDMGELVRGVLEELRRNGANVVDCQVAELPVAYGDRNLLRQVWMNLMANAVKFSAKRPDPRIEVGAREDVAETVYFVRDNGVGFDMQYYHKLFGVFQRLHRQDQFAGTGVGLAIVQRIVVRHGGRVWAEGRLGEGAQFSFALPKGVVGERTE